MFLPHAIFYAENSLPSERQAYYYAERARGGAGLIVVDSSVVHPSCLVGGQAAAYDERSIPGYWKITEMTHKHGAKIFLQLHHFGSELATGASTWKPTLAPSELRDPYYFARDIPKEMDEVEIREVIAGFAKSASNAQKSGFDGVELKAGHDGLLREFLSPFSNRRTDRYGGSLENRMRFILEVIEAIRQSVGRSFSLGVRLSLDELRPGGYNLADAIEIGKKLAATGLLDYLSSDIATLMNLYMTDPPMVVPPGFAVGMTAALKEAVDLPVIAFGRINDPVQAEKILVDGQADLVGMCRALVADPELPLKAREGRLDDIRNCVACNQGCLARVLAGMWLACIHNPAVGREKELGIGTLQPARTKKKIVVIGGGPAGMKVAEIAARRGHSVALFEKEEELGGQIRIAIKAPYRDEFGGISRYLITQLKKLGVEIHLKEEATVDTVQKVNPDAVVVATGSVPMIPNIPGVNRPNVVNVRQVLTGQVSLGDHVLIIDEDGHQQALTTADYIASKGKKLQIITSLLYVGAEVDASNIVPTYKRLQENGAIFTPTTTVKEIGDRYVVTKGTCTDQEKKIEDVDNVVIAFGNASDKRLYNTLKGRVKELHAVGDCVVPRRIEMLMYEAELLARSL